MTAEMLKRASEISEGSRSGLHNSGDRNTLLVFLRYSIFAVVVIATVVVCAFEVITLLYYLIIR